MSFSYERRKCQRVVTGVMEGRELQPSTRALRGDGCGLQGGPLERITASHAPTLMEMRIWCAFPIQANKILESILFSPLPQLYLKPLRMAPHRDTFAFSFKCWWCQIAHRIAILVYCIFNRVN